MAEALAEQVDLSASKPWSLNFMRDYFSALIGANDKRYITELQSIREILAAFDLRYEQRFATTQKALSETSTSAHVEIKEKAIYAEILHVESSWKAAVAANKEVINAAISSAAIAVQKSENASDRRFEAVNEFRNSLGDQQRTFMPRNEVDVLIRGISDRIEGITNLIKEQNERQVALTSLVNGKHSGMQAGWGYAIGVIGLVMTVVSLIALLTKHPT